MATHPVIREYSHAQRRGRLLELLWLIALLLLTFGSLEAWGEGRERLQLGTGPPREACEGR